MTLSAIFGIILAILLAGAGVAVFCHAVAYIIAITFELIDRLLDI